MGFQDTQTAVVVGHNDSKDPEIHRIPKGKGTNIDFLLGQQFGDLCDSSLFVFQKYRYLLGVD
jgi:hypothetical protein